MAQLRSLPIKEIWALWDRYFSRRPDKPNREYLQSRLAYKLQEEGLDTVDANLKLGLPADLRDYGIGAQILRDLGLRDIRILTNNPKKIIGLEGHGLRVTEQIRIEAPPNLHNEAYLQTKRDRMGHILHHQGLALDEEMIHGEEVSDREKLDDDQRPGRREAESPADSRGSATDA